MVTFPANARLGLKRVSDRRSILMRPYFPVDLTGREHEWEVSLELGVN